MTDSTANINPTAQVAPLRNVVRLAELVDRIVTRAPGLPGLGVFYGPSGYGKSYAAIYAGNSAKLRAYHVEVNDTWSRKHLVTSILKDMGLAGRAQAQTVAGAVDLIGEELATSGRPLLIDEADILIKRGMIEVVRAIYECSQGAVILIGEEELPQKLMPYERVHNRVLDWVGASPIDLRDGRVLAGRYCPDLAVADDLLSAALGHSDGRVRRLVINLNKAREIAAANDLSAIDLSAWTKLGGTWFSGNGPGRRGL